MDDNPLVGTLTQYEYGSYPIPEVGCRWMKRAATFHLQRGKASVSAEEREWIHRAADYWANANVFNRTRGIVLETLGVDIGLLQKCGVGTEFTPGGMVDVTPDYGGLLTRGVKGLLAEIEQEKARLDLGHPDDIKKWHFYTAATVSLKAIINFARRYASLAEEMASRETEPQRKAELERIAATCRWVPANPPRNFYEALQSVWFVHLGVWMESPFVLNCPPSRFTQYMYPFYRKDKEEGKLTEEEVIELLQLYFIKINGLAQVMAPHGFAWSQSRLGQ